VDYIDTLMGYRLSGSSSTAVFRGMDAGRRSVPLLVY